MTVSASEFASRILKTTSAGNFTLNRLKNLTFCGRPIADTVLTSLLPTLNAEESTALLEGVPAHKAVSLFKDTSLDQAIRAKLIESLTPPPPKLVDPNEAYFNSDLKTPMAALKVVINVERPRESFLYDPQRDLRYPMAYELIRDRLDAVFGGKGKRQAYETTNAIDCVLRYEPQKPRFFPHPDQDDVQVFNTWEEAEWEAAWKAPGGPVEAPEFFTQLLTYLTDRDESRHYLEAWLRDAAFARAEPILVLCGVPGTGKNLFIEQVAAALVGKHNYRSASRGFNRTQFHSNVTRCRLFYLDETKLTDAVRETLKAYHNGNASIERKGVDIGDPEPLFASFAVSNNDEACIQLEHADRKFYAPDLSSESMEDRLGRKGAKAFADKVIKAMANPKIVRQLADYLYLAHPAGEATNFKKETETFGRICLNSFPPWFSDLLTIAAKFGPKRVEIPPRAVFPRGRPHFTQVRATILKYAQVKGEVGLSTQITSEGEWNFVVNPSAEETKGFELYENGHAPL